MIIGNKKNGNSNINEMIIGNKSKKMISIASTIPTTSLIREMEKINEKLFMDRLSALSRKVILA